VALGQSLRASLASVTPTWLQNSPGFRNLYSLSYVIALLGDNLREIAWEGRLAAYPGVGTPTANPYIGASRGLIQGPNESNAVFAARCLKFRQTWRGAGSQATLASNIQAVLQGVGSLGAGNYPVVRNIDRLGEYVQANADTTITHGSISWLWDNVDGYVDAYRFNPTAVIVNWHSDAWTIIQDPFTHYSGFGDPNWTAAWNSGDQTIDAVCPQAVLDAVMMTIKSFKAAHSYQRNVVFVPNVAAFVPAGIYGNASTLVGTVQTTQRVTTNSYWDPPGGG
jgi:hypothetical protein